MRAYSVDLRERVVAALGEGQTEKQVAVRFGVSESSVTRYSRLYRAGAGLLARKSTGRTPLLLPAQEPAFLSLLKAREDWTLSSIASAWREHSESGGTLLSKSAVHEHLQRLGYRYKKRRSTPKNAQGRNAPPFSSN